MNSLTKKSPFASYKYDTASLDVAIALLPIVIWSVFIFSWRALLLTLVGCVSCVFLEVAVNLLLYKKLGSDLIGAGVTGVLIALATTVNTSVWAVIAGSVAAILVAKYPLVILGKRGGLFSPATLGMLVCSLVSGISEPFFDAFRSGAMPEGRLIDLFIGNTDGAIGKVSVMLALAAGIYLMLRGAVSIKIVFPAIAVFAALSLAFYPEWTTYTDNIVYQILCGGFLFCLIFAACDRSGTPFTSMGKMLYGALFALFAFVLRSYTSFPQPELLSVLILNALSPVMDALLKGTPFGGKRKI